MEILDAGIDVYTTLNVQHIESLNDTVARITGIREPETVPDALMEEAEITVVDLAPEELFQRLKDGKVYLPDKDSESARALYRIGILTALRELALRRTADRVDEQMRAYMSAEAIQGPWLTRERVMVCLGADALAPRLVRSARQMAASLRAEWVAVHIQTAREYRRTLAERQGLEQALTLATAQGAQAVTLPGQDVATELLAYARAQNVTKLVVGKYPRSRWRQALKLPLADELVRQSGDIHVLIVTPQETATTAWDLRRGLREDSARAYILSLGAVVGATLVGLIVRPYLAPTNIALIYLLAVVLSATSWGLGPAIFSSVMAVLAFDILFVPPYGTFAVHDPQYILTFFIFLLVGILISELGSRLRAQVKAGQLREEEAAALYALSQSISRDTTASLDAVLEQLDALFGGKAIILRGTAGELVAYPPVELPARETQAAKWSLTHRQTAGQGTKTFSDAERLYLPLVTAQGTLGVLGIVPNNGHGAQHGRRLLETLAGQVALALEHSKLSEQAEQARLLEATDRFRDALLSSLSHDLRTPLASILGAATGLLDEDARLDEDTRRDLEETIKEEATRLNRYVANLLNLTRLESGTLKPQLEWNSVEEVVGSALARTGRNSHPLRLDLQPNLPLVPFDSTLMEQVLINLLDNANKFSPPDAPIEVKASLKDEFLQVSVLNGGTTVPAQELDRIFEKFYRVADGQGTVGMGLGLSIAKGIIEAHGGTMLARQREKGGMEIGFRLPAQPKELFHE
jgi:two-component system sensor histidine kinase KdpD